MAYTDKPYREWLDTTEALLADVEVPAGWDRDAPMELHITFAVMKPKTSKLLYPKPDIDNYAKAFMDAVTQAGNLWTDDSQVVRLHLFKHFTTNETEEGIVFDLAPTQ